MSRTPEYIYKIATQAQWNEALESGIFKGAPIDLEDGYIHFSTAEQVRETAAKHFKGQKNLLLVTVEAGRFTDTLKWEASRGGALFPHLYAQLPVSDVLPVVNLEDDGNEGHIFPGNLK